MRSRREGGGEGGIGDRKKKRALFLLLPRSGTDGGGQGGRSPAGRGPLRHRGHVHSLAAARCAQQL